MNHTEECRLAQATTNEVIEKYREKWPNHCQKCGGWGGWASRGDMVPYGSTRISLPDNWDPCTCTEGGKCPRCGGQTIDPDTGEGPCTTCGWTTKDGGEPLEYDGCYCWDVYNDESVDL